MAGGALNAVDEGSETAKANKDSVALHYKQTYEGGDKQGDPDLIHTLTDNAWKGVEWLKSMGMEFKPGITNTASTAGAGGQASEACDIRIQMIVGILKDKDVAGCKRKKQREVAEKRPKRLFTKNTSFC